MDLCELFPGGHTAPSSWGSNYRSWCRASCMLRGLLHNFLYPAPAALMIPQRRKETQLLPATETTLATWLPNLNNEGWTSPKTIRDNRPEEIPGTNTFTEMLVAWINGCHSHVKHSIPVLPVSVWAAIMPGPLISESNWNGKPLIHRVRHPENYREHTTRAIVKVGVLAPRKDIILLFLNSTVILVFAILMTISPKSILGFFQPYYTQEVWEFSASQA